LNAYSPQNCYSAYQQYVIAVFGNELVGSVDNWPLNGANIINDFFNLTTTPSAKLPAGYELKISLLNDAYGSVTGATYVVIDNEGNTKANVTKTLQSISQLASSATAPSLAVFDNSLYVAFIAKNPGLNVLVCSSTDAVNWPAYEDINQSSPTAPSLAVFDNSLYAAFIANNPGQNVLVCSTTDGVDWTNNTDIKQSSKAAPSLAVFKNRLYVAFIANNPGNAVLVCSSADGVNWTNNTDIKQSSKFAPSLAVFNNRLYVSFIANNSGNAVLVCSSADGVNWTNNTDIHQSSQCAPSLAVFNDRLYVAFIANNSGNAVLVCSSADGVNFTNNTDINQSSGFAPSLAVFNNRLYVSFIANNPGQDVLVCSSANGVNFTNNSQINPDLAPIVAFELDLVGPVNGESAQLSSGAGTIVYAASSALTALTTVPSCVEAPYTITAETANSFYGALPSTSSNTLTQSFSVSSITPMIRKQGKIRPGLIFPAGQK
jgi:hypothetical protein